MSNHLPMALLAIDALGLGDEEIERFARCYEGRLEPVSAGLGAVDDWSSCLGESEREPDLLAHFDESIVRRGREAVLADVVPRLLDGLITDAFHPLLRLSYGLAFGREDEIAAGLAYWVATHRSLPPPTPVSGARMSPVEVATQLSRALADAEPITSGGLITPRLVLAAGRPEYRELVDRAEPCLSELAVLASRLFVASDTFVSLHAVTATHAARVLLEHVPKVESALLRELTRALLAVHVVEGCPELAEEPSGEGLPDWPELVEATRGSDDDHGFKLVHSCREEEQQHGGTVHRWLARRRVSDAP